MEAAGILALFRRLTPREPRLRPMRAFLLGLCLVAAIAPAQDQERVRSTKPTAAASREQRLQQVVGDMVALVEKHSGLKFEKPPSVRAATHAEWRAIVQRQFEPENGLELFDLSVGSLGFYMVATDEVVLSPLVVEPLVKPLADDAPRHVRDAVAHQQATIAHEIVHALQQVHFGLPKQLDAAKDPQEIRRLKFLIEGHAVLIEELIAERELGLEGFMEKMRYADQCYRTGRRYFLHVLRSEGMRGVIAKLTEPPELAAMLEIAQRPLPPEPAAGKPK